MGMSRTITVNTYTQKRVQFQSERSSFSLFISHFELSELCVLYDSHVVHYLHALCHPLAHYTARVWVWLRIDAIAAFTDDWNNLHQTIADSVLSKSSPGTGNSFIPSDFDEWIVTAEDEKKITIETTAAAPARQAMPIAIWISSHTIFVSQLNRRHIPCIEIAIGEFDDREMKLWLWLNCDCCDLFGFILLVWKSHLIHWQSTRNRNHRPALGHFHNEGRTTAISPSAPQWRAAAMPTNQIKLFILNGAFTYDYSITILLLRTMLRLHFITRLCLFDTQTRRNVYKCLCGLRSTCLCVCNSVYVCVFGSNSQ